jgi:cytochrome oxidase Cu insertion factor (SCO1/SenC/PrrC family)
MRSLARLRAGCVVVVACGLLGCGKDDADRSISAEAEIPKPASVRLLDLDDQPFDLWAPGRAAITVVLFMRTDCPISNQCAPEIRRLYDIYHARGVEFFLVYVDPSEPADAIRRHLLEFEYPCRGLRDPQHTLVAYCHATTTPEAVVFGKDHSVIYQGRVDDRYADLGRGRAEPTSHDLADAIEATIQGRPVANPRTKPVGCVIADLSD